MVATSSMRSTAGSRALDEKQCGSCSEGPVKNQRPQSAARFRATS